jgi:hypothetical protein|eukprot:TRINITY_DN79780_c0_g2_i1.p1 TRINITY_DN79780_c0_g2~~TRINITY_DN79780_c0_g2_i1.p1  ORF type:complete len:201 (-),score=-13.87 TRINITY_DN79780_c0_g2_i1:33-635(-)
MSDLKDLHYYRTFHTLVLNALLHLLFAVSTSHRFVPVSKRNEILAKYLKPKLKEKAFSNLKKDIRLMLNIAKSKQGNLETRLYELHSLADECKPTDLSKLMELLVYLNDEANIDSKVYEEGQETLPNVLYMLESHIEHCFDENEMQVAPVSMLIHTPTPRELIKTINEFNNLTCELKEWDRKTNDVHLLLHPMGVKTNLA